MLHAWVGMERVGSGPHAWGGMEGVGSGPHAWGGMEGVGSGPHAWVGMEGVGSGPHAWGGMEGVGSGPHEWVGSSPPPQPHLTPPPFLAASEVATLFEVHPLVVEHMVKRCRGAGRGAKVWVYVWFCVPQINNALLSIFILTTTSSPAPHQPTINRQRSSLSPTCLQPHHALRRHRAHRPQQHFLRKIQHAVHHGGPDGAALGATAAQGGLAQVLCCAVLCLSASVTIEAVWMCCLSAEVRRVFDIWLVWLCNGTMDHVS
jgi:hypothetical protein